MIKHASDNMLELLYPIFNNNSTNLNKFITTFGDKLDYIKDFIIKISNAYNFKLINESEVVFNIDYAYKIDFHLDQIGQGIVGKATIYQNSNVLDIDTSHIGKYIIINDQIRKIISYEDGVSEIEGTWTNSIENADYSIIDYVKFYKLKTDNVPILDRDEDHVDNPVNLNQATTPYEFFNSPNLFFIDNGVYTRDLYQRIDIGGAVFEDMELYHIWGIYDEIGLLLGCPRITGERNSDYVTRLKDVFTNPGNSTTIGLTNYLKRALGTSTIEFEFLDKKLEGLNTPVLSDNLIEYIDLSHKINKVDLDNDWETFKQLKKGEVFLSSHIGQGAEYLPFNINLNEKVLVNGVNNERDLLVSPPRLEDEYDFTAKVFHKSSALAATEFYPELLIEYAKLSDAVGVDSEATHFKATILAGESTNLEFTIGANKIYKEKWIPNYNASVNVSNSINSKVSTYGAVISKGSNITTSNSASISYSNTLNYFDGIATNLLVSSESLSKNGGIKGTWISPLYEIETVSNLTIPEVNNGVIEYSINGKDFESSLVIPPEGIYQYQLKVTVQENPVIDPIVVTRSYDYNVKYTSSGNTNNSITINKITLPNIDYKINKINYIIGDIEGLENEEFSVSVMSDTFTINLLEDKVLIIKDVEVDCNYLKDYIGTGFKSSPLSFNGKGNQKNKLLSILWKEEDLLSIFNSRNNIVVNATSNVFTSIGHGFINGDIIKASYSTLTEIEDEHLYYVIAKTDDTFKVSLTLNGSEINIIDETGSVTLTSQSLPYWLDIGNKELITSIFSIKIEESWQKDNPNITISPLYEITNINVGGNLATSNVTRIRIGGDLNSSEDPSVANGRNLNISSEYILMVQNTNPVAVHYLEDTISMTIISDIEILANTNVFTKLSHGFENGDYVKVVVSDPEEVLDNKYYYVVFQTPDTFNLALTKNGTAISVTETITISLTKPTTYNIPLVFSPTLKLDKTYDYWYRYGWTYTDPKDVEISYVDNLFYITPILSNTIKKITTTIETRSKTTINVYNTLNSATITSANRIKVLSVYDKYSKLFIDNSVVTVSSVGNNHTFSCNNQYKKEIEAQLIKIEQIALINGTCRLNNDYNSDIMILSSEYTFENLYIESDNVKVKFRLIKVDDEHYTIIATINNYDSRIKFSPIINSGQFNINLQKYHVGNKIPYKSDLNIFFDNKISFIPGLHSYEAALITSGSSLSLYTSNRILTTTFDLDGNLYPSEKLYLGENIITKEY